MVEGVVSCVTVVLPERVLLLLLSGLLACGGEPTPTREQPATTAAAPTPSTIVPGVSPPTGFVEMDPANVQRVRAATVRKHAEVADFDAWVAAEGGSVGLVVSMRTRRPITEAVHGHTLRTWVRAELRALEDSLTKLHPEAVAPRLEDDPVAPPALLSQYALPLPAGSMQVRSRHWLSADDHWVEASCLCAGTGCTEPPACRLPPSPTDAQAAGIVLGAQIPFTQLQTSSGSGQVQAPAHLTPLPAAMKSRLEQPDPQKAPRRSSQHVQGRNGPDGSGVILSEATWCEDPPACDAETLAENRRKAEVSHLRAGGTLRSIETLAAPHRAIPIYGFEVEQHDGFWTRTVFWNEGSRVREVSCACAGLACALARRTCSLEPHPPTDGTTP